jgi:hypothetical protein
VPETFELLNNHCASLNELLLSGVSGSIADSSTDEPKIGLYIRNDILENIIKIVMIIGIILFPIKSLHAA